MTGVMNGLLSWLWVGCTLTESRGRWKGPMNASSLTVYISLILQSLVYIPGILCGQASKSSSLGGQQILDCNLQFPTDQQKLYIVEWRKAGLKDYVYLQYQGFHPNINPDYEGRVTLVNGISLQLSQIQAEDEGWYECRLVLVDGIESENGTWIYLTVHIPPKIDSSSPASFHQPLGSTAKLFCRGDAKPPPKITWSKDGVSLSMSSRIIIQADGSEVIITNLQIRDGGIYKCTFQNAVGLISQNIHLIVEGQAYIIDPPTNKTAVPGQRISFKCEARGYPSNITYRWNKDGRNVNLLPGYGTRIQIFENDGSLIITNVEKEDIGWYLCRPSNGQGEDPEASAYLNVIYKPLVLVELIPRSLVWALGFQEGIDCPVDANPPVNQIVWTKNGEVLDFRTNRMQLLPNGTLLISKVRQEDAGNYRCTAINNLGNGESEIIQVEVKDPPKFIVRPEAQYIHQPSQSVIMPCAATGMPIPRITWRRPDQLLQFDTRVQQIGGNLSITNLNKGDHGIYECEASNEVHKIVTTTELIIQNTTPHSPYNVTVVTKLFSANVRWIPAYSSRPQHFVIWYRTVVSGVKGDWQTLRVEPQNATQYTLYRLEPDTLYEFKVLSRNDLGDGQYSDTVEARTKGYEQGVADQLPTDENGNSYFPTVVRPTGPLPGTPVDVSAVLKNGIIYIDWRPPYNTSVKIFKYMVQYTTEDTEAWHLAGETEAPKHYLEFKPPLDGRTYDFIVISYGVLAWSNPSSVVSVKIPADEGFGLSSSEMGGIIGGPIFLIVAIALAVMAVLCSKRRGRQKRQAKYGNVKYQGPQDNLDERPKYPPEWSAEPYDGRGDIVTTSPIEFRDKSVRDTDIFMVPQSGTMYNPYSERRLPDPRLIDPDSSVYRHNIGNRARQVPSSVVDPSQSFVSGQGSVHSRDTSRRHRSRSAHTFSNDSMDNDENGFRDYSGSGARNRSRSHPPSVYHSAGPSYPVPERPRSRGHSMYSDGQPDKTFQDISSMAYRPHSQSFQKFPPQHSQQHFPQHPQPMVSPHPSVHKSLLSPVIQPHPHHSYSRDDDDDEEEEVFMPPPISSILPSKPGFPRHSSMKPGAQTYLTEDFDLDSSQPFADSNLSSVLPSPFTDTSSPYHRHYQPYQRQYPSDHTDAKVPYVNISQIAPRSFNSSSFEDIDNTVVARPVSLNETRSRTLPGGDDSASSESSGRPMNYTRDQLIGVVDRVRRGPRASKKAQTRAPRGSHSSDHDISSVSQSAVMQPGVQVPESVKPSVIVRDRPSRSYPYEYDFYRNSQGAGSRASVNSSGQGSYVGRGRNAAGTVSDSKSQLRDDLTPDSLSSGIGSRNTSSQLTGSSLHSRPSRLGSNLTSHEQDISEDSAFNYPPPQRKDISGDENYEFDSYNAVESDLLEALRNYSEVNNDNGELLNALQEGLNTSGMFADLYPKPSRQSRYSDSEQRFEKLRGEFQKYRQKQQEKQPYLYDSFSRPQYGGDTYGGYQGSKGSAINGSMNYSYPTANGNQSYRDNAAFKAGPMDSDML